MEVSPRAALTIAHLFEKATGQHFSEERFWRISAMLTPFCRARGIESFDRLAMIIERSSDPELSLDMIDALLNNETSFFRDPTVFIQIKHEILPRLAMNRAREKKLRLWSAACSSGQEAYSLAMLFAEHPDRWSGWKIEILGTDISRSAIKHARGGLYTQFDVQRGLPVRQLIARFDQVLDQGWRAKPELQEMVTFNRNNMLGPPPSGGRFDLILCRNALLYFSSERRHQLLEGLALSIAPDGALLLGAGETALGSSNRFVSDGEMPMVYRPAAHQGISSAA